MSIYGYTRVSSTEQAEEGLSLGAQEDTINRYCQMRWDCNADNVFVEAGVSAFKRDLAERKVGRRLLSTIKRGDKLVVYRLDRVFRILIDGLATITDLTQKGIEIHAANEGGNSMDISTSTGWSFLVVRLMMAEFESRQTSERTKLGMRKARSEGRAISSQANYGYRIEGSFEVENPEEIRVLQIMRELKLSGLGSTAIALRLNQLGFRNRMGGLWTKQTVSPKVKNCD